MKDVSMHISFAYFAQEQDLYKSTCHANIKLYSTWRATFPSTQLCNAICEWFWETANCGTILLKAKPTNDAFGKCAPG